MLPLEVVFIIWSFLPWILRTQLLSRNFLHSSLLKRPTLNKWRSHVKIYSFIKTFGPSFSCYTWHDLCCILHIRRKTRNIHLRLTWQASVDRYMDKHCRGCGATTRACVMGWPICHHCRCNSSMKECYMVSIGVALSKGIDKNILTTIPYHVYTGTHLRFWKEIQNAINVGRNNV
jgi:hypothetical protein